MVEQQYNIEDAKKEMNTYKDQYPLSLMGDQPLRPDAQKGPDSDFYELEQCEKKNITTVLVENLFTEIAVLMILMRDLVQEGKDRTFANYVEADQYEDLVNVYMVTFYNLIELTDVKDMLLGQHVKRDRKLDEGNIQLGFQAYINGLKRDYGEQLERLRIMGVTAPDDEVLQRIEANGGDVEKTAQEFYEMDK